MTKTILVALAALATITGVTANTSKATDAAASYTVERTAIDYVTRHGSTSIFPGALMTGDRVLARDTWLPAGAAPGYDNEVCTVTFDRNDACEATVVFPGEGSVHATWLWINRNGSVLGPRQFSGVIDGGTGRYAGVHGQFRATALPSGALEITASFG
jgi:hypothetical protein